MSTFVFEELSARLFPEHHIASLWTSSLYVVSSPPEIHKSYHNRVIHKLDGGVGGTGGGTEESVEGV